MTFDEIKDAPNGTTFAFINIEGGSMKQGEYVVTIMRKTGFSSVQLRGKSDELKYEGIRTQVKGSSVSITHVRDPGPKTGLGSARSGSIPLTDEAAEKYYSRDPKDIARIKHMVIQASFLPGADVDFEL